METLGSIPSGPSGQVDTCSLAIVAIVLLLAIVSLLAIALLLLSHQFLPCLLLPRLVIKGQFSASLMDKVLELDVADCLGHKLFELARLEDLVLITCLLELRWSQSQVTFMAQIITEKLLSRGQVKIGLTPMIVGWKRVV